MMQSNDNRPEYNPLTTHLGGVAASEGCSWVQEYSHGVTLPRASLRGGVKHYNNSSSFSMSCWLLGSLSGGQAHFLKEPRRASRYPFSCRSFSTKGCAAS